MAITRIGNPAIADQRGVNFRNIIINGDMSIAQRATSTSSITSTGYHTVDRFQTNISSMGTWTQSQSTDVPSGQGFVKSLKMDCTTADASPSAGDQVVIEQKVEGQNLQYLNFGNSSAKSLTLSFWVKSNKTGTYCASLFNNDQSKWFSKQYTISSADTWEKKTLTYAGDTSNAFNNDNGTSLRCRFWLGAGSTYTSGTITSTWTTESGNEGSLASGQVNLADSTSNEWYVTGVQLEAGQVASDFEFLPFDVQQYRCMRYFEYTNYPDTYDYVAVGTNRNTSSMYIVLDYRVLKRANPSVSISAAGTWRMNTHAGDNTATGATVDRISENTVILDISRSGFLTAGYSGYINTESGQNAFYKADCEL